MPIPWLRLIDGLLGASDFVRLARGTTKRSDETLPATTAVEQLPALMVGALREVFDRDRERTEIERLRLEEERQRAERAMRFELLRQAGERELTRLRIIGAVALLGLLTAVFLVVRLQASQLAARAAVGFGGVLLIAALLAAFDAQARLGRTLGHINDRAPADDLLASGPARAAAWLVAAGLASMLLGATIG